MIEKDIEYHQDKTHFLLEAIDIRKSFYDPAKVDVLKSVNLRVCPGHSVAIMGRSGEGKSTLLQILGTLDDPCGGTLKINGQIVSSSNRNHIRNQSIGFVFQSFHLLEDYTAIENVLMPAKIARKDVGKNSAAKERAIALLEKVGLADRADFNTKLLSGGEKQRVALARALCNDPKLIFADEPSGNLDRQTALLIHEILLGLAHEGKSIIIVTHDQELANLCSRKHALKDGILV